MKIILSKKWIIFSFFANGCCSAVTGDDFYLVGKGKKTVVDGLEEGAGVAAGQVSAADGTGEECVAGDEEGVVGEVEAAAAFGVPGGVDDGAGEPCDGDEL